MLSASQASAASEEMSDFLSLFTHEARTPLASVDGFVQLAQRRLRHLQAEVRRGELTPHTLGERLPGILHTLEQALAPARRLNGLLADLAEVAQVQSGGLSSRVTLCNLNDIVRKAIEEQQLGRLRRKMRLSLPESTVWITADPDRIAQVVTNYLTNALKVFTCTSPHRYSCTSW